MIRALFQSLAIAATRHQPAPAAGSCPAPRPRRTLPAELALSALALGLQANVIRSLHVPDVSTTAFTAAFIDLFSGLATWKLTAHSAQRLTATVVGMAAGALLGDLMLRHAHRYAPVVPAAVTAVVIAIAFVALKPRATSGATGERGLPVQQAVK